MSPRPDGDSWNAAFENILGAVQQRVRRDYSDLALVGIDVHPSWKGENAEYIGLWIATAADKGDPFFFDERNQWALTQPISNILPIDELERAKRGVGDRSQPKLQAKP